MKLTFCGEKKSAVKKKKRKKKEAPVLVPHRIRSTFTRGYRPSWSRKCEHTHLLLLTWAGNRLERSHFTRFCAMFRLRKRGCYESFESEFSWGRGGFFFRVSEFFFRINSHACWYRQLVRTMFSPHSRSVFNNIRTRTSEKLLCVFVLLIFYSVSLHDAHDTSLVQFPFKNTHHFCWRHCSSRKDESRSICNEFNFRVWPLGLLKFSASENLRMFCIV